MKKLLMFISIFMACVSINAQKAIVYPKVFDNVYMGANIGASTPLTFNPVVPINTNASLRIGKDFNPIFGAYVEGKFYFGDNVGWSHNTCYSHTVLNATNVTVNGTVNWMNLLCGYPGTPRFFEVVSAVGVGWLHTFGDERNFTIRDDFSVNNAIDFNFNISEAWQLYVEPNIFWNMSIRRPIQFNKNWAQLGLNIGFNYKFKTSNGTHNFKVYDINELNTKINNLQAENESLRNQEPQIIEKPVIEKIPTYIDRVTTITFAKNSANLSAEARTQIANITAKEVMVVGYSSPEGSTKYNQKLSEDRATAVKEMLESAGIKVTSCEGRGAVDDQSNRVVMVIAQ